MKQERKMQNMKFFFSTISYQFEIFIVRKVHDLPLLTDVSLKIVIGNETYCTTNSQILNIKQYKTLFFLVT